MVAVGDIHPANSTFSFVLEPGYIYAFTTHVRQGRPAATPPAPGALGTYVEQPDANPLDDGPGYLAAQDGAFRYRPCQTAPTSRCIQQMTPQPSVYWVAHRGFPYAVIGDPALRNYTVSLRRSAHPARFVGQRHQPFQQLHQQRRHRQLPRPHPRARPRRDLAAVQELPQRRRRHPRLRHPADRSRRRNLAPPRPDHQRSTLTANSDGQRVGSATDNDANYVSGIAGIEAGATEANGAWTGTTWPIVQYRHLAIAP
jgi:hypothetical protein